jgi:hypothetical protein
MRGLNAKEARMMWEMCENTKDGTFDLHDEDVPVLFGLRARGLVRFPDETWEDGTYDTTVTFLGFAVYMSSKRLEVSR